MLRSKLDNCTFNFTCSTWEYINIRWMSNMLGMSVSLLLAYRHALRATRVAFNGDNFMLLSVYIATIRLESLLDPLPTHSTSSDENQEFLSIQKGVPKRPQDILEMTIYQLSIWPMDLTTIAIARLFAYWTTENIFRNLEHKIKNHYFFKRFSIKQVNTKLWLIDDKVAHLT